MRIAIALFVAVALGGCASARPTPPAADPEVFSHTYEFTGLVDGKPLAGRVWFRSLGDPLPLELNMTSAAAGNCRTEVRAFHTSRLVLHCGAIALEFLRRGQVVEQPNVAWTTVQQQVRQGCVRYVPAANGQTRCAMFGPETRDVPVTVRGTVSLSRVAEGL